MNASAARPPECLAGHLSYTPRVLGAGGTRHGATGALAMLLAGALGSATGGCAFRRDPAAYVTPAGDGGPGRADTGAREDAGSARSPDGGHDGRDAAPPPPGDGGCGGGVSYRDLDGDGFGDPTVTSSDCAMPPGYVGNSEDCDDAFAERHPGAAEKCNGVDDDCDGVIDDGDVCPCAVVTMAASHTYLFCGDPHDWEGAAAACVASGYTLVRIDDADENRWITDATRGFFTLTDWWIGASDIDVEGRWIWTDGDPVGWTTWRSGEPNDSGGEDCGELGSDGQWNDTECWRLRSYVCESR